MIYNVIYNESDAVCSLKKKKNQEKYFIFLFYRWFSIFSSQPPHHFLGLSVFRCMLDIKKNKKFETSNLKIIMLGSLIFLSFKEKIS